MSSEPSATDRTDLDGETGEDDAASMLHPSGAKHKSGLWISASMCDSSDAAVTFANSDRPSKQTTMKRKAESRHIIC
jgi:hypothetical protein